MFYQHPEIVQQDLVQKIEALHVDTRNEALARAQRKLYQQHIIGYIATSLRKLADKLEPSQISTTIPNTNQHLRKQVR